MNGPCGRSLWLCGVLALCGCFDAPAERPNVVLVVLDTVRADAVNERITPNVHALSEEATVFDNAWSVAPWTVPSHASIFTGMLPSVHGCTSKSLVLKPEPETLAERLAAVGYESAAFFSNPWLGGGGARLLRGFDVKWETPQPRFSSIHARYIDGDQGGRGSTGKVRAWLDQRPSDRPFFLFVNLLEAHLPYDPPDEIRQRLPERIVDPEWLPVEWGHRVNSGLISLNSSDRKTAEVLYHGDVFLADRFFGDLRGILVNGGVWDDTVVIVTSDHGENLGDHNLAEHQFSLHETLLDVPLVIRAPGRLAPGTRNDPVMLTDLFATILDLAGADYDPSHGLSRSLLSPVEFEQERPVVAEYSGPSAGLLSVLRDLNPELDEGFLAQAYRSVRVGTHRLTISSSGLVAMHDLEDDPRQSHNLADGRPELVSELTLVLRRHFPESWESPGETPEITGETRERLEELGYVASGSRP